jgi:prefoldin subunit 5
MLQSRLKYFFSSLNMINLFKRTVRQTINTVKELDAAMTGTAVVTDFTVGDMWGKLPQYAE